MTLSNKQKQFLKGQAHSLKPVVLLGSNGLTEGVVVEIQSALEIHELIKVKVPTDDRETKALIFDAIVRETGATKLQTIGHTVVLYRQSAEKRFNYHAHKLIVQ
ncbi:ribosome assembly RNA-binding protein YhbY [Pseudoalteromonas sp. Hal099]